MLHLQILENASPDSPAWDADLHPSNASTSHEITRRVREQLAATAYRCLRNVQCEHHEGVLVLRGQLESFYLKQLAQEVARKVPGVEMILNAVEVIYPVEYVEHEARMT